MSCQNGTFVRPNTKPNVIPSAAKDLLFTLPRRKLRLIPFVSARPQPCRNIAKERAGLEGSELRDCASSAPFAHSPRRHRHA